MLPAAGPATPPPALLTATPVLARARWSQTFPALPVQVRHARRALTAFLGGWPLGADAVTCLSELATNAIEHSHSAQPGGTITVCAALNPARLHIAVQDQGGPWQQPTHAPGGLRGRGLDVVAALADCWGKTSDDPGSRTVWYTMTAPHPPPLWKTTMHPTSNDAASPLQFTVQGIADDYPGWDIRRDGHWWSATCPAVSLQADTPEGLRAALERAINPDAGTP